MTAQPDLSAIFEAIDTIRKTGDTLPGKACAAIAEDAFQTAKRTFEMTRDLPPTDISECQEGDRVNMPPDVLYMLTIRDDGNAQAWCSDRVGEPHQFSWLHGIVLDAAASLAADHASPSGLN